MLNIFAGTVLTATKTTQYTITTLKLAAGPVRENMQKKKILQFLKYGIPSHVCHTYLGYPC